MTAWGGTGMRGITIRRIDIDDHAAVRYVHTKSMLAHSGDALSETEIASFAALVNSPMYSDCLLEEDVYGAFVDGQLVGTASWQANGDDGRTARISSVFVDPMFSRLGVGRLLLAEVEAHAIRSGFGQFGISAMINSVPFFEKLGYREASRGVRALGPACSLPVAFLRKTVSPFVRSARAPAA